MKFVLGLSIAFLLFSCASPKTTGDSSQQSLSSSKGDRKLIRNTRDNNPNDVSSADFENSPKLKFDPSAWKLLADQEGIRTFEKIESSDNRVAFRGEAVIPAELAKIATILSSESLRKEWIDGFNETYTIEKFSDSDRLEYFRSNVPWPFQDRDFVYRASVQTKVSPPTMLISMVSTEDDRAPPKPGIVRGRIIYSYYFMKQVEGVRATQVIVETSVDPGGALPKWLVTLSQKKWPFNTLTSLKRLSQREDIVVSDQIRDYFIKTNNRGKKR